MNEARWRLDEVDGLKLVRCVPLEEIPGVAHAFSTRRASGGDDFDLGQSPEETADVRARRARFLGAAGLGGAVPAVLRQVHGRVVVDAGAPDTAPPEADGVVRVLRHVGPSAVPAVRTADCVPVLVADRRASAVAALHAGWRGVAAGIVPAAVARLADAGAVSADLVVALGPAIGGCCYEVGEEVLAALDRACGYSRKHVRAGGKGPATVDLHAALRTQLVAEGVPDSSIHAAPWCTRCRTDLFFSFRAEGHATGRLMAAIGPSAGP